MPPFFSFILQLVFGSAVDCFTGMQVLNKANDATVLDNLIEHQRKGFAFDANTTSFDDKLTYISSSRQYSVASDLASRVTTLENQLAILIIVSMPIGVMAAVGFGIGIYSVCLKRSPRASYEKLPAQSSAANDNSAADAGTANINNEPAYE